MSFSFYFSIVFVLLSNKIFAEEITSLPGLHTKPSFKQYSGYLKASGTHFLHYWFVESQNDPTNDPLVTWMNGGPGCSSMEGFLTELGPFWVNDDGQTLNENPYAWNKEANVLFIESPAGVGYSYSTDGNVTTDDDQVSAENYAALRDFFAKFPQFQNHDLYLTGESYAGIYVPTFAVRIIENMASYPLKLKGIATGNGMLSFDMNTDTLIEFAYNHGLIDEKIWKTLRSTCCNGCTDTCAFHHPTSDYCNSTVNDIMNKMFSNGINMYDLYGDCAGLKNIKTYKKWVFDMMGLFPKYQHIVRRAAFKLAIDEIEDAQSQESSEREFHYRSESQWQFRSRGHSSEPRRLGDDPPCTNDTAITGYLTRSDVRAALFIPNFVQPWVICSDAVGSTYKMLYENMVDQFRKIMNNKIRVLIYHGDTDMACNFLMGQQFPARLSLQLKEQKRAWFSQQQIAGFVTKYKGLDFLTVKGAGHMVPTKKPAASLRMIQNFIKNVPY